MKEIQRKRLSVNEEWRKRGEILAPVRIHSTILYISYTILFYLLRLYIVYICLPFTIFFLSIISPFLGSNLAGGRVKEAIYIPLSQIISIYSLLSLSMFLLYSSS
jgi:hypothetical protein